MKKSESIVFDVNFMNFENKGKADRFFTLYKQLRRNRELKRFCRDAFMEKANRYLGGVDEQHTELQNYIKSKGIQYILDAIHEKENPKPQLVVDQSDIERMTNQIIEALSTKVPKRLPVTETKENENTQNAINVIETINTSEIEVTPLQPKKKPKSKADNRKPNMEKLKALL
ncbi:hypothetical protein [Ammoniphilus sp. 3BR4]|uniref:hypothetical protein n=1 Tax=Ammoniphilus sp. 3BR4 TaxID=3158265 RepID=UPI00346721A3